MPIGRPVGGPRGPCRRRSLGLGVVLIWGVRPEDRVLGAVFAWGLVDPRCGWESRATEARLARGEAEGRIDRKDLAMMGAAFKHGVLGRAWGHLRGKTMDGAARGKRWW